MSCASPCRIRHTHVLDDPFDDPAPLADLIPEASPGPTFEQGDRLEDDWKPDEDTRAPEVIEDEIRQACGFQHAFGNACLPLHHLI